MTEELNMEQKKPSNWDFAGIIFLGWIYFLIKKMWVPAAVLVGISIIVVVASEYANYDNSTGGIIFFNLVFAILLKIGKINLPG